MLIDEFEVSLTYHIDYKLQSNTDSSNSVGKLDVLENAMYEC